MDVLHSIAAACWAGLQIRGIILWSIDYITEELLLAHFSGPFSQPTFEQKIGLFQYCPFQVATKDGAPGDAPKY
ncbi:hypothetical protein SERLA73DRAFT_68704 [Serpula lacrymans var. lacrymans S7.3]|uniref:Uncharacterized protein n=1 Tax=Serpula lacrymans var. lacrymans (strain S7.3) TaxID=936435 RepID=F8PHR4_SERL3|nr:hypothetical protein SERLA73DRAFT_68704 [Serpula lacrymans var. lacrymans S7.3]